MSAETTTSLKLFYCYAREDKALRDELEIHLSGLKRQYNLIHWHDQEIIAGEEWEHAIDEHLSTADLIILLISPHFVASDYCYGKEMQRALERHQAGTCRVIPILLHPTYWEDMPFHTIQLLPTDAKPLTSWANRYEAFHDIAKGVSTSIKALLLSRRASEEWLGNTLRALDKYEEALTAYDQALRLDPTYAVAWYNKGRVLHDLRRYEEALTAYDQALRLDPNYARPWCGKGNVLYDLKRFEEALVAYDQTLRLDPNYARPWYGKALTLSNLKRYEEALAVYDQALHLDPTNASAWHYKGIVLRILKRNKEARQAEEKARQLGLNEQS